MGRHDLLAGDDANDRCERLLERLVSVEEEEKEKKRDDDEESEVVEMKRCQEMRRLR